MDMELTNLSIDELRVLLRQETRKFLWLLDHDGTIEELEALRSKLRVIADALRDKAYDEQQGRK
jgi:hypothetical protein